MKKISLDLDALSVDSFSTSSEAVVRQGTVKGHGATEGGDTCATDNVGSWCCWNTDTTCGGGGDSWYCGDDRSGASHAPSCGAYCDITGIAYKCYDDGNDWDL